MAKSGFNKLGVLVQTDSVLVSLLAFLTNDLLVSVLLFELPQGPNT